MARSLRVEQQFTVDELAARLSLPRSTIYYWVRDLPLRGGAHDGRHGEGRDGESAAAPAAGPNPTAGADSREGGSSTAPAPGRMRRKTSREYDKAAYEEGLETFEELSAQPTFRDFICIYLVQGDQRDRMRVALTDSDPAVMRLVSRWIGRLTNKVPFLSLRYGPDQSLNDLRRFWSETTGAEPRAIRVRRSAASKSDEQAVPELPHGLLTVGVDDTLLSARLQGWMHRARESWR
jgi:transposase-like protein